MSLKSKDKKKSARKKNIDQMLIEEYEGFAYFVIKKVHSVGRQKVLEQSSESEFYWLRREYNRILDHSESIQIKQIPQKVAGGGEDGEFVVRVEISDGNNITQEPGNRIQEYFKI